MKKSSLMNLLGLIFIGIYALLTLYYDYPRGDVINFWYVSIAFLCLHYIVAVLEEIRDKL